MEDEIPQPASGDVTIKVTRELSPDALRGLLVAGMENATRELRAWEPPSVEELQRALPQYEISEFIARGGMGAVYKGTQRALKRTVAIKILPPDIEDGEAHYAERFKHEAQAMARLSHPNIVAVFDAGEVEMRKDAETGRQGDAETGRRRDLEKRDGGVEETGSGTPVGDDVRSPGQQGSTLLYFVMEFIEGTDVAQLIASEGALDPKRAVQITTAVCEALAFAHEEGIIHRDIKPSNIMLDKKGRVKVADFGLAKTVNVDSSLLTGSNMAMGTPDFIAPETMIAGTLVDQRADLYAVGVMLYQMLTGKIPRGRFDSPSTLLPQVDKGFDAIVDKAMQTDREKRYSTAGEMRREVENVVQSFSSDSAANTKRVGLRKPNGLKPVTTMAALAAVVVLGAGGWMAWKRKAADGPSASSSLSPTLPVSASSTVTIPGLPDLPPLKIDEGEPGLVKEITLANNPFLHRIALLPDSRRLLTFRTSKIDLIDLETETQLWSVDAGGDCESHAVSRDGRCFAHYRFGLQTKDKGMAKGQTAVITLRTTKDGSVIQAWTLPVASMSVSSWSVAMAPSGKRLVARVVAGTSATYTTQFVALEEGHAEPVARWTVPGHNGQVLSCVDEDRYLSTGNGPAMLLSVAQPGKAEVFAQTGADLNSAISPDGHLLVACDPNAGMAVWDTAARKRLRPLENAPRSADMVAISSTGAVVMMGDAILRDKFKATPQAYTAPFGVWDSRTGVKLCSYQPPAAGQTFGGSSSATTAANGTFFATVIRYNSVPAGGAPNTVQIWRLPKPGEVHSSAHATSGAASPPPQSGVTSASSTRDAPFVNTLGMKFVPVPITGGPTDKQRVLFSIWETRVQDYEAFAKETKREWPKSPFEQGAMHPAVSVSWEDATAFCAWLTDKERKAGKIGGADEYRLPSDHEWSCAVGIGDQEDGNQPPGMKQEKIAGVYPWGTAWPPPKGMGNYHDESGLKLDLLVKKPALDGYDDGWARTAPVGSFPANALGLFDLSGNVSEWCNDWMVESKLRVVRGGEYAISDPKNLLSSYRMTGAPEQRYQTYGFRVVLAVQDTSAATGPHWPAMPTAEEKKLAFTNTLGMKFVPVPGTEVLFCIHETRKGDYAAYAAATPGVDETWSQAAYYRDTPVSPTPEHPVVRVSLEDAQGFCAWLSQKEGHKYRLPTDYEWSCAVGIGEREDKEALPTVRGARFVPDFAWGTDWPPPKGAGNIGDETLKRVTGQEPVITGYDDGFATTAPVMSFPPNTLGIHDLAGNAWEWCPDRFDSLHKDVLRRGSSFDNGNPEPNSAYVAACVRNPSPPTNRSEDGGFRIVAEKP